MITKMRGLPQKLIRFHTVAAPTRAPKYSEVAIWINVENDAGIIERIQGRIGDSLFNALYFSVTRIGGYCTFKQRDWNLREKPVEPTADIPYCNECMVELGEHWYKKLEIHPVERDQLEQNLLYPINHKVKRLSCCVTLEPWMNEMWVRIPFYIESSDRNVDPDGLSFGHN